MRGKTIVLLLAVILLTQCASTPELPELPFPEDGSIPFGQAIKSVSENSFKQNNAISTFMYGYTQESVLGTGFRVSPDKIYVLPDEPGQTTVQIKDDFIYYRAIVVIEPNQYIVVPFEQEQSGEFLKGFYKKHAALRLSFKDQPVNKEQIKVLAYSCTKLKTGFDCHNGKFQAVEFTIVEGECKPGQRQCMKKVIDVPKPPVPPLPPQPTPYYLHYVVVGDQAPISDVTLSTNIIKEAKDDGIFYNDVKGRVNYQVGKEDLDKKVTVVIKEGDVKIVVGETSPVEHTLLATKIAEMLENDFNIDMEIKDILTSNEVQLDDLMKLFGSDPIPPPPLPVMPFSASQDSVTGAATSNMPPLPALPASMTGGGSGGGGGTTYNATKKEIKEQHYVAICRDDYKWQFEPCGPYECYNEPTAEVLTKAPQLVKKGKPYCGRCDHGYICKDDTTMNKCLEGIEVHHMDCPMGEFCTEYGTCEGDLPEIPIMPGEPDKDDFRVEKIRFQESLPIRFGPVMYVGKPETDEYGIQHITIEIANPLTGDRMSKKMKTGNIAAIPILDEANVLIRLDEIGRDYIKIGYKVEPLKRLWVSGQPHKKPYQLKVGQMVDFGGYATMYIHMYDPTCIRDGDQIHECMKGIVANERNADDFIISNFVNSGIIDGRFVTKVGPQVEGKPNPFFLATELRPKTPARPRIIDYREDFSWRSGDRIEFGKKLLDFETTLDFTSTKPTKVDRYAFMTSYEPDGEIAGHGSAGLHSLHMFNPLTTEELNLDVDDELLIVFMNLIDLGHIEGLMYTTTPVERQRNERIYLRDYYVDDAGQKVEFTGVGVDLDKDEPYVVLCSELNGCSDNLFITDYISVHEGSYPPKIYDIEYEKGKGIYLSFFKEIEEAGTNPKPKFGGLLS